MASENDGTTVTRYTHFLGNGHDHKGRTNRAAYQAELEGLRADVAELEAFVVRTEHGEAGVSFVSWDSVGTLLELRRKMDEALRFAGARA